MLVPASWDEITNDLIYIDLSDNLLSARIPMSQHCLVEEVVCVFDTTQSLIEPFERKSLDLLYDNLGGNRWSHNYGWKSSTDPCLDNWYGVVCSHEGHVTQLLLTGNNLVG